MDFSYCAALCRYVCLILLSAPALGVGCTPAPAGPHDHGHGSHAASSDEHDHAHEEERESQTLWTDELEVFAEYPLLVAGESQEILLHLTHVATGLPVRDVLVTYRALPPAGGNALEGQAPMLRPGLYVATTLFPAGGDWSMELHVALESGAAVVALDEMDVHGPDELHDHGHHEEAAGIIALTKEQQWVVPVVTAAVREGGIAELHKTPAVVLASPDTHRSVIAPIGGTVLALESGVFPVLGDTVEAGQTVARILPLGLSGEALARESNRQGLHALRAELALQAVQASGEASRIRALLAQQEGALERARRLWEARAGARRDVDALQGAVDEARAALAAAEHIGAEARRALAEAPDGVVEQGAADAPVLTAPISGRISRLYAGPGSRLEAGQPLLDVIRTDSVMIEGRVPEYLAPMLAHPPSGRIEIPAFAGTLIEIQAPPGAREPWMQPYVDADTRTVPVLFSAANPDGRLLLGMQLTLWLDGQEAKQTQVAPASAVIDENGVPVMYVMVNGERFERRFVRLGIAAGDRVEIIDGVRPGERVVSQGAYVVRLAGLAGGAIVSAHVH